MSEPDLFDRIAESLVGGRLDHLHLGGWERKVIAEAYRKALFEKQFTITATFGHAQRVQVCDITWSEVVNG